MGGALPFPLAIDTPERVLAVGLLESAWSDAPAAGPVPDGRERPL